MYKILIVDDEEIVRSSIVRIVDWTSLGFSDIYQAENGVDALELALREKPDLVLTDIKMPFMDGLELSANLREQLPYITIVVFSGYDEFKYAQEAISLGVMDYILKPFGAATLTKKLKEIKQKMDDRQQEKQYLQKMKSQLHLSLPLLKENYLNSLVCIPGIKSELTRKLDFLDMDLTSESFVVCVVEPDLSSISADDHLLYSFAVKNMASETSGSAHAVFSDSSGRIILLVCISALPSDGDRMNLIIDMLNVLHKDINIHLEIPATIGIGTIVPELSSLYNSYCEALTALDCRFTLGKDRIYNIADLHFIEAKFIYPSETLSKLLVTVKTFEKTKIRQALLELGAFLKSEKSLSPANIKIIFIEVVTELLKLLTEIKGASPEVWSEGLALYGRMEKLRTIDEMVEAVAPFAGNVSKNFAETLTSNTQNVVQQAMEYIRNNFQQEELSLISVASSISVSAGYLSALFKKEAGVNFSDYLTRIRMDTAMQLLRTTDLKTYEIAYRTGFSSPHYFSISFKKYSGKSPSEYRGVSEE